MDGLTDGGGVTTAQVGARVLLASVSRPGRALGDNALGVGAGQGQGQVGLDFTAEPSPGAALAGAGAEDRARENRRHASQPD